MRLALWSTLVLLSGHALAQPGPGQMPPTPVEAVRPEVGTVSDRVSAVGSLRAAESIVVQPELPGRIDKVHFEEGQNVAAGAPLFTLDASMIGAEVREWEANVAQRRRESERANELVARKLVAQNEADAKRSALAVDEARLSSAKTRMSKMVIRAPFAGVVGLRMVSPGEYVETAAPLVNLVQVDPVKLDFRVPEVHLARVAPGQKIAVTLDAFPGQTFEGTVYAIEPQVDAKARNIVLRANIENDDARLKPGLFARVSLELGRRENALLLPEQALWPVGDKQFVYVIKAGKAELAPIEIGQRHAGKVEVLSGLAPDALVITAGQLKIGPGMAVQPVPASAPPPAAPRTAQAAQD